MKAFVERCALLLLLLAAPAAAQPAFQVADLRTQLSSSSQQQWPYPAEFIQLGNQVIFTATDGIHGLELWITDGTTAGTHLVADICPGVCGSSPFEFVPLGSRILFRAGDGAHGHELWETDGTAAGTRMIKDLVPGVEDSYPSRFLKMGETIFFSAQEPDAGREIWKTDGTAAGTVRIADVRPGAEGSNPAFLAAVGSFAYFQADDGVHGLELWKTDGTAGGTSLVKDVAPGTDWGIHVIDFTPNFSVLGGRLFFVGVDSTHGEEIWSTDGTEPGTMLLKDISPGNGNPFPTDLVTIGTQMFFQADDGVHGSELWKTDGTEAGTVLVKDIQPGAGGSAAFSITPVGSQIFLMADDGTHGRELWVTDGTEVGTVLVKDIFPGTERGLPWILQAFTAFGNTLLFFADDGVHGQELWQSDGTEAGTSLLADLNPGPESSWSVFENATVDRRVIADGHWYFRALTGGDLKYWISDGTTAGTRLLATINTQSSAFSIWSFGPTLEAGAIVPFQGGVAFPVEDDAFHADIWKTDGTPSGTFQLDGASGSDPLTFHTPAVLGSSLFFTAEDGVHGAEVWKSDGQPGDAAMFQDLSQQGIYELVRSGDRLFFPADGQIWSTDGTLAGTTAAAGTPHGAGELIAHTPGRIAYAGGTLETGGEPWGADAGSSAPVADINPGAGSSYLESLLSVGPLVYFFADDGATGRELWKSDGVSSAERVKDIRPGPASSTRLLTTPENFTMRENASLGTRVFFAADDGVDGEELWVSDGTEAGTVRLADINPGAGSSQPQWLTRVRNNVYFVADDGVHGRELWVTDGTVAGTALAKDILPGAGSSVPQYLAAAGPALLFAATDGIHGLEPWKSDGTAAGTVQVQDIAPGTLPSTPFRFVPSGPNVYFPANDGTHGFELWAMPRAVLGSTFGDVPTDYWAFLWIEALVDAGITGGCGGGNYCPERPVTRAEAAVFLVRAAHGPLFTPPPPFDMGFNDVPPSYWAAAWIDQLVADGVTSGCGNFNFCPDRAVTRAELAVLLLRSRFGLDFFPPAGTGAVFGDVPADYWARDWIEHLVALGVTGGCGNGDYCPDRPVTRAEMAVLLARMFELDTP
jgi:ELWxxDGT repeat protein